MNPNELTLSDGRVIVMRETDGRDEIAASQMLGSHMTADAGGSLMFSKAMVLRAIVSVDGKKPVEGATKFKDFMNFWANIKTRDGQKLLKLYAKLNGDDEDPLEEESDSETPESETSFDPQLSENQ